MSNITEKEIKKLAEDSAIKSGYPKSDKEQFTASLWTLHNVFVQGYKAALQNKVGDISAEEWKVFSHTSALGNTGDYMSDCGIENGTISFYCDKPDDITNEELQEICDSLNASIVNERKDNAGSWVKASERLPGVIDKKCTPVFIRAEIKGYGGKVYISKRVAFYFPDHFKTIEFEDWDDYNEDDYPYIENDQEKGVCWLRAGWYESVNCEKCEDYWNSPLNVIEWLDESQPKQKEADEYEDEMPPL